MFSKDVLLFLAELKENNHKIWFEANRKRYENTQDEIKNFVQLWINNLSKTDCTIENLEPKKCIFRINRDVRFSKNKSPYKNNLGAYINKGGKNNIYGGYYLHLEPNNCFFGAGKYDATPEDLAKIRQEIDYNFDEFKTIITNKKFKATFGDLNTDNKLKKCPKGYEENNPALEYLKLKSFTVVTKIDDTLITNEKLLVLITDLSKEVYPFVNFLNKSLE